jgi:hypothetical protein
MSLPSRRFGVLLLFLASCSGSAVGTGPGTGGAGSSGGDTSSGGSGTGASPPAASGSSDVVIENASFTEQNSSEVVVTFILTNGRATSIDSVDKLSVAVSGQNITGGTIDIHPGGSCATWGPGAHQSSPVLHAYLVHGPGYSVLNGDCANSSGTSSGKGCGSASCPPDPIAPVTDPLTITVSGVSSDAKPFTATATATRR